MPYMRTAAMTRKFDIDSSMLGMDQVMLPVVRPMLIGMTSCVAIAIAFHILGTISMPRAITGQHISPEGADCGSGAYGTHGVDTQ